MILPRHHDASPYRQAKHHDAKLQNMRTTVTLDDDVYSAVKEEMKNGKGKTFKESVNDLIRRGRYASAGLSKKKKVKLPTFNMGVNEHLNFDKPRDLIEELEGPFHR